MPISRTDMSYQIEKGDRKMKCGTKKMKDGGKVVGSKMAKDKKKYPAQGGPKPKMMKNGGKVKKGY